MSTFAPAVSPQLGPYDPTKHVNYTVGMVLGVDDFNQEFAYLDGRDRRIARDLVGYGVVAGLRVTSDVDAARGPRVQVAPGEALTPSGRFVCVTSAQCAYLNDWLAANPSVIDMLGSPPPSEISLSVVACWQQAATDSVPIPGEPCRTDSELMAPSRLQDSFSLELRTVPPAQSEEDAVREFVAWVRQIPLVSGPGPGLDAFVKSLSSAMDVVSSPPTSPPGPVDFLLQPPPADLQIPSSGTAPYLHALMRFWTAQLRPLLRSPSTGAECDCAGGSGILDSDADCVTLAALQVPIVQDAISGVVTVNSESSVTVDDSATASVLDVRVLQEWLLAPQPTPAPTSAGGPVTAAGLVASDGSVTAATGGLAVLASTPTIFVLGFTGYDATQTQVVLGQPVAAEADASPSTFEAIAPGDPGLASQFEVPPPAGVAVRVKYSDGTPVPGGFMVRIEQFGGGA